jgi:uncharacterized protein YkwD
VKLAALAATSLVLVVGLGLAISDTAHEARAALDTEEQALLILINDYRVANGRDTLSLNTELTNAAEWMSNDMAANDYLSHTDSLGRDPFERMADFGYDYSTSKGETLAAGMETAQTAFDLWKNSPVHNAIMLDASYRVIGIGRAYGADSIYGWYWTADFGGLDPVTPTPTPSGTPTPTPMPTPTPTPCPDTDGDGFSDCEEAFVGTDPTDACANTPDPDDEADDKWPADLNDDQTINILDIVQLTPPVFGTSPPDPNYAERKDFNGDGIINILDIVRVTPPTFGRSCTP